MLLAHWRVLAACGTVLMISVLSACDLSPGPSPATPTPVLTPVPTATPIPTPVPTLIPTDTLAPEAGADPGTNADLFPTPVMGPSTFTGSFMADQRPYYMDFLSLTQSGNEVNGFLTNITPDGRGGTHVNNIALKGTSDSDAVTLSSSSIFGGVVYTARLTDNQLTLSFPTNSGVVGVVTMTPASEIEFDGVLGLWQSDLARKGTGAYLGVTIQQLTQANAKQYDIKDVDGVLLDVGVLVQKVEVGSAAERAGVEAGDVIMEVNNVTPSEVTSFHNIISDYYPNDTVTLTILRRGKRIKVEATLGARP
jgi:PDZ domain